MSSDSSGKESGRCKSCRSGRRRYSDVGKRRCRAILGEIRSSIETSAFDEVVGQVLVWRGFPPRVSCDHGSGCNRLQSGHEGGGRGTVERWAPQPEGNAAKQQVWRRHQPCVGLRPQPAWQRVLEWGRPCVGPGPQAARQHMSGRFGPQVGPDPKAA